MEYRCSNKSSSNLLLSLLTQKYQVTGQQIAVSVKLPFFKDWDTHSDGINDNKCNKDVMKN